MSSEIGAAVFDGLEPQTEGETEVIAAPVTELSTGASPAAVFRPGGWQVVYASEGDIWIRSHSLFGWGEPVRLTNDPAESRDPHIVWADGALIVVWEDERVGHPEIWSRRQVDGQWGPEFCISLDSVTSRHPAIAGDEGGALVYWQNDWIGGRSLLGRSISGGEWEETIEAPYFGSGEEFEPSLDLVDDAEKYVITWTDTRSGQAQIYAITRYVSGPYYYGQEQLTNSYGPCRRSSVKALHCCGDAIMPEAMVLYDCDNGVPEIYSVCWHDDFGHEEPVQVSPADGVASRAPCAAGFDRLYYWEGCDGLAGELPSFYGAWSDEVSPGAFAHRYFHSDRCPSTSAPLPISGSVFPGVQFVAAPGRPDAQLIALWIEEREGVPTLVARRATTSGCHIPELVPPRAALMSPGGTLTTVVLGRNQCGFDPVPGLTVQLDFAECPGIAWDSLQTHPLTEEIPTNSEGEAVFHLRGGGCVRECLTTVLCDRVPVLEFTGARSSDVDGDCFVGESDRAYIVSMLGTGDFCADLDGSGIVNEVDLQLVDATMGEHCSQTSGVSSPLDPAAPARMSLVVQPNPCRGEARISLHRGATGKLLHQGESTGADSDPRPSGGTDARVSGRGDALLIVDVNGRQVRRYDLAGAPGSTVLVWDTRDAAGRVVPAGIYRALLTAGGETASGAVIVLR